MEPRAILLFLLFAVIFTTTEGSVPRCCVTISENVPCQVLRKVQTYHIQDPKGACEIHALVVNMKNKTFCIDVKYHSILKFPKNKIRKWLKYCKKAMKKL